MTDFSSALILHNYPQSPVAEKVRVAFGIKGLTWHHVEIPRLPPKENLVKLTGGYRRTPVAQIGADIYCDSACIIMELEKRFPSPTFFPTQDSGLLWFLSRLTDGAFFDLAVKLVLGSAGDNLPQDFAEDRGRLYFGTDWAAALKAANSELPHIVAQMRAMLLWLDDLLSDGRSFLTGEAGSAFDAQVYHAVWFIRGRWEGGPRFLSGFDHLERWENRMLETGHGTVEQMEAEKSLEIAAAHEPVQIEGSDSNDPQGLKAGMEVTISPDVDGGEQPVSGIVAAASGHRITLAREELGIGNLHVHFPRAGYKVQIS